MICWQVNKSNGLKGVVNISTSKNSTLPIMAASLLMDGETRLYNLPKLSDISTMSKIIMELGASVNNKGNYTSIVANKINKTSASKELVNQMRASFLIMGPMLARYHQASIPLPGGCNIGTRPVDLHLMGFQALGADIEIKNGIVNARGKLKGNNISFKFPSVGASENIISAAVMAKGTTVIENAAREPEIIDLCNFLRKAGAKIEGDGSSKIVINGVNNLTGVDYQPISDRVEAGTFMYACAATKGNIRINNINPNHVKSVSESLRAGGIKIIEGDDFIEVSEGVYQGGDIYTKPYPGFPTDLQAPAMVLACVGNGVSNIYESVFENRYNHAGELYKMGANIDIQNGRAQIIGTHLHGAKVNATDLRAGAALIIAGLCADGLTLIKDIGHIKRGYDGLAVKLNSLGADLSIKIM